MKQRRVASHILSFVLVLFFLTASSAVPAAEEYSGTKVSQCMACCANKKLVCFNLNPDRRLCTALHEECVKTCESGGVASSDWRDCWSGPNDHEKNDESDK